jgi:NitT/TauT family transport system substrate-binding protein
LNFVAFDQGYSNLGEVTDYIREIVFTALIVNGDWATQHRAPLVALLESLIEATRVVYDAANDPLLTEIMMELGQTDQRYAERAIDEMRALDAFALDLAIPEAALAKSLELMHKAKLADDIVVATGPGVIDDRFRIEALGNLKT